MVRSPVFRVLLTLVLFALVLPAASAAPVVPPHSEGFTDPVVIRVYYDDPAQIAQLADFDVFEFNNKTEKYVLVAVDSACLLYTSPSPRDRTRSRMPSSA